MADNDTSYLGVAKRKLLDIAGGIRRDIIDAPKDAGEKAYQNAIIRFARKTPSFRAGM